MSARHAISAILLFGLGFGTPSPSQTGQSSVTSAPPKDTSSPLSQQIDVLLQDDAVSHAHWGISVLHMDGTLVYDRDAHHFFRPASTAKLFTTAAALALLGPDHRFSTTVRGALDSNGTVQGDLLLVGGGDPSFGTNDLPYGHDTPFAQEAAIATPDSLRDLTAQLAAVGIQRVTGSIVGDDTLFEAATVPAGWAAEDLPWGYGALPNALSFGDNQLEVTIQPSPRKPGIAQDTSALISTRQVVPWLQVTNSVITHSPAAGEAGGVDALPTTKTPQGLRLLGSIAPDAAPVREHLSLTDPAAYAASALRSSLLQQHVFIKGEARALHRPFAQPASFTTGLRRPACEASQKAMGPSCVSICPASSVPVLPVIAEHLSAPLSDDVLFTLKTSANLHAELILHHLGLVGGCAGATTLQGVRVLQAWLLRNQLEPGEVTLFDGSGLSTKDLVTPHAETRLLAFAATQPWFPRWFAALPVGGLDGTLASRFPEPALKGHVFAKTGTLGETRALAGYLDCASGQRLIFAILVDNHQPGSSADRSVMDKIVATIAREE